MSLFKTKNDEIRVGRITAFIIILFMSIITLFASFTKVDVGCTGIQVVMGSVQTETLDPGFHFKLPFVSKVVDMDNKVRKVEVNAGSTSKDLQSVDSTLAVNYHLAKESSLEMYKNVGLNYEDTILQPAIQEATKSVMAGYRAEELIQSRGLVSNAIRDEIAKKVGDYGIVIDEFNITNFSFSSAFDDAIEQKLVAEQNKMKAATENEQRVAAAKADAEEAKARADGEAEAAKIKAQGEAEVIKTTADAKAYSIEKEAEATAKANEKINASITPTLIDYNKVDKWNGQGPTYVGDSNSLLFNMAK